MKKIFTFAGTLLMMCILLILPSEAKSITNSPASMAMATDNGDVIFTINDVEVYTSDIDWSTGKGMKEIDIWITEKEIIEAPEFLIYCYDNYGNHIDSEYVTMEYSDKYSQYFGTVRIDSNTASIEIQPAEPGEWYNSFYYYRYERVSSPDGRKINIHDMLVPNYKNVGWYEDVWLYALDGRELKVAYCDVPAYKAVGWYEWEEISMIEFRAYYKSAINSWDYEGILDAIDSLKGYIENPYYLKELADAQCYTMDKWRVELNAPMALVDYYVFYDEEVGKDCLALEFRNVSYATIAAYKTSFICHDIFGDITREMQTYYSDKADIAPGAKDTFYYKLDNFNTDYISSFSVDQVVFEDRTSWYR